MSHSKILIQLDPDKHASSFDAVVAVDSGVDQLIQYHFVEPSDVQDIVHGAMFTRGPGDLKSTAIFVGGSDVTRAERLVDQVSSTFFGPMRVSVLMDANGSNTTASAAVVAATRHMELSGSNATVLAGTGPVGQRVALLLSASGCNVRLASRSLERAQSVCDRVLAKLDASKAAESVKEKGRVEPVLVDSVDDTPGAIDGSQLVVAAGAAGIQLLSESDRRGSSALKVAIDLNAVPPLGIEGTAVTDTAKEFDGVICYGAIGIGGTKMKIHKESIRRLFSRNDLMLDALETFQIGCELEVSS